MKIRYIGKTSPLELTHNKVYDVISVEKGWYRIIIDEPISEDYLYPPELFEVVVPNNSAERPNPINQDNININISISGQEHGSASARNRAGIK